MALSNKFGWMTLGDRQQERALGGLLDALRRHGGRVRADQGRLQDARLRAREVAQRSRGTTPVIPQAIIDKAPSAELRPDQKDADSLPPYPRPRRDTGALRREGRQPRRHREDGIPRRDGRPGHPPDRHRRVQAAPGADGRQDHAEGVRQGPPDAGDQPIRRREVPECPLRRSNSLRWTGDRFDEVLRLAFAVLYEPFGLSWPEEASAGADWMHPAPGTRVAVALSDGRRASRQCAAVAGGRRRRAPGSPGGGRAERTAARGRPRAHARARGQGRRGGRPGDVAQLAQHRIRLLRVARLRPRRARSSSARSPASRTVRHASACG